MIKKCSYFLLSIIIALSFLILTSSAKAADDVYTTKERVVYSSSGGVRVTITDNHYLTLTALNGAALRKLKDKRCAVFINKNDKNNINTNEQVNKIDVVNSFNWGSATSVSFRVPDYQTSYLVDAQTYPTKYKLLLLTYNPFASNMRFYRNIIINNTIFGAHTILVKQIDNTNTDGLTE